MIDAIKNTFSGRSAISIIANTILAGISSYALMGFFEYHSWTNVIVVLAFFMASLFGLGLCLKVEKRVKICSFGFSLIFTSALFVGRMVYRSHSLNDFGTTFDIIVSAFFFLCILICLTAIVSTGFSYLLDSTYANKRNIDSKTKFGIFLERYRSMWWVGSWCLIFLCLIFGLLAYYPGILSYDSVTQTAQAITGSYDRWHPPLHTFLWMICLNCGDGLPFEPITLYALLQIFFVSFAASRSVDFTSRIGGGWVTALIVTSFFMLNPAVIVLSLTHTKDILFGTFFLLLCLRVMAIIVRPELLKKERSYIVFLFIDALLCCLFRNNAVYIFLIFLIIIFFVLIRKNKTVCLKICGSLLFGIIAFSFINGPVYDKLGVASGYKSEMLSVPLQQIAKVVNDHEDQLTIEDKEQIERFVPYEDLSEHMIPRLADPVKRHYNESESLLNFFSYYFSLGLRYPKEYAESFLDLNIPYWYPFALIVEDSTESKYIETSIKENDYYYPIRNSKLLSLYEYYETVANGDALSNIPILAIVFSLSTPLWLLLLMVTYLIARKEILGITGLLLPILLLLTYIVGPVSLSRYIYPLMLLYPTVIVFSLKLHVWRCGKTGELIHRSNHCSKRYSKH